MSYNDAPQQKISSPKENANDANISANATIQMNAHAYEKAHEHAKAQVQEDTISSTDTNTRTATNTRTTTSPSTDIHANSFLQLLKYLFVGGSSALLELILFSIMTYIAHIDVSIAAPVSLLFSTLYNFFMSARFTFRSTQHVLKSALGYCALLIVNTLFASFAVQALVALSIEAIIAKLITMACYTCWNFVLYKRFIFKST